MQEDNKKITNWKEIIINIPREVGDIIVFINKNNSIKNKAIIDQKRVLRNSMK